MSESEEKLSLEKKKRLEQRLRLIEKRDRILQKDQSTEREVLEEVLDRSTVITLYDFINKRIIEELYGAVKSGKEAKVYWGRDPDGRELAIKIYLIASAEFKRGMLQYIEGDPRFSHVKRSTRSLVYTWARKEFKNLQIAYAAQVNVPEPITVNKNVLIMQFIGENGVSAPLIKEIDIENPSRVYKQILVYIEDLYQKAKLVHGDLSEYNIMMWKGKPVLFDVSQAVSIEHPMADTYLRRDIKNLHRYFTKLGVTVSSNEDVYRRVTGEK